MNSLKIYPAIFSVIVIYSFTWSILEPIPENWIKGEFKLFIILAVSVIVFSFVLFRKGLYSFIYYRYIKQFFNKNLQFLSMISGDSLVNDWYKYSFKTASKSDIPSKPEITDDILFNKVCYFSKNSTEDTYREFNVSAKHKGTIIDYFLKPIGNNDPRIYIKINARDKGSDINKELWMKLVLDKIHTKESREVYDTEELVYVDSMTEFMGWLYFSEDISEKFNKIERWKNKYNFNSIIGIKVRGDFNLASISVYK